MREIPMKAGSSSPAATTGDDDMRRAVAPLDPNENRPRRGRSCLPD
jgi:hypothetical protein